MPPTAVHFNGGVNLPDTTTVLRTLAERVPHGVHRLPDGETGERANWIGYQLPLLIGTPGLERVDAEAPSGTYGAGPKVRLAAGTDPEAISWPDLGYAREYSSSYAKFAQLRAEGVIPSDVRFQVEYPTALAVSYLFDDGDRDRITPSYERALFADLDRLLAAVAHEEVAVQWDAAVETVLADQTPSLLDTMAGRLVRGLDHVPSGVPAGMHLCYGDFGHKHMVEPENLATQVRLANAVTEMAGRPPAWLSFTVPQDRGDSSYFEPLAELRTAPETELYFALVPYFPDTQPEGTTDAQVRLIDQYLPSASWGICTECGMARADRADVPRLIDLHREILASYGEVC